MHRPSLAIVTLALLASSSHAQTFLATQGSKLYRFGNSGAVTTFTLSDSIVGMTTVPSGMNVGNVNGGASGGDVLCMGLGGIYRMDNPLGAAPSLTFIGSSSLGTASPVFVGGHLYGPAAVAPGISVFVELSTFDFSVLSQTNMGDPFGIGGMVATSPTDFYVINQSTDRLARYHLGDNFTTPVAPMPNADYGGMEAYGGTMYATLALRPSGTGRFVFGSVDPNSGFTQIRDLDNYSAGITGLAIVTSAPEPGSVALLALGLLGGAAIRRRRARRAAG